MQNHFLNPKKQNPLLTNAKRYNERACLFFVCLFLFLFFFRQVHPGTIGSNLQKLKKRENDAICFVEVRYDLD